MARSSMGGDHGLVLGLGNVSACMDDRLWRSGAIRGDRTGTGPRSRGSGFQAVSRVTFTAGESGQDPPFDRVR
ncbi:hypothetical protein Mal15_65670 [Stieleria maiorica]|uniref:Uncharacterized protein n=1 Tax=Stieleria maiorica TaxID=2795974 RepID=A0A5B9MRL7_9BACT|nr:hypothetical protein Mal15_65670 [Stieleria maiorica]